MTSWQVVQIVTKEKSFTFLVPLMALFPAL